jgi:lipid-binding SYLF domain-containing protein
LPAERSIKVKQRMGVGGERDQNAWANQAPTPKSAMKQKEIMRTRTYSIALALSVAIFSSVVAAESELQAEAQAALDNFYKADPSLKDFVAKGVGYAVFPNVGKGGFIVGGAHGKGVVYENGKVIGHASMTQATVGAQVGGQSFAEMIVFENSTALNDFKMGKYEMSADVSGVVAGEGASKAAKYKQGVAVFTLPKKGLMAEASIGGQKFKFEPIAVGTAPKTEQDAAEKAEPKKEESK